MRSLALVFVLACSSSSPPPTTTPPGSGSGSGSGSSTTQSGDNDPSKAPPENAASCKADPTHCCQQDDGAIIAPTCAPVVRQPSDQWKRGPDGMCMQCPLRCLPPATRIRTPGGDARIDELHAGDLVMTEDALGRAVAMPLLTVRAVPRTGPHTITVVELGDGRIVRGSAGHPTASTTLGALVAGDLLDGARVIATHSEPFTDAATWDVLPAGPTGTYWADGVLLGSTLRNR